MSISLSAEGAEKKASKKSPTAGNEVVESADQAFVNFEKAGEIDKINADMEKCFQAGQYEQALSLAHSVVNLCEKNYGKNHSQTAKALNNLAWHEQNAGDFNSARLHFEEALGTSEALMGKESPKLVPVLNNLAMLLAAEGDAERSLPLLERALQLEEKVLGKDSTDLANTLNNLAVVYDAAGRHKESIETLRRAYEIQESGKDFDEIEKALTLSNLAMLEQQVDGDLLKSEKYLELAFALRQKHLKENDPDLAELLNNLAMIELKQKKSEQARQHLEKALSIVEKGLSTEHLDLVAILNNLSMMEIDEGNLAKARERCIRSTKILDKHINNVLPALSFAEQRSFLNAHLPAQISLLISSASSDAQIEESYSYLYRWKGLLIDALRRQSQLNALSKDESARSDIQKLIALRSRFTELFHNSGKIDFEDWNRQSDELAKQKESLERKLASTVQSSMIKDPLQTIGLQDFCKFLKSDEMLVDIYSYEEQKKGSRENSYAAFLLDAGGKPQLIKLGESSVLNNAAEKWLKRCRAKLSNQAEFAELKKQLSVLKFPPSRSKLFISPDADLSRLPLALFFDNALVSELDSPRELLYMRMVRQDRLPLREVLAVGGIEFKKQIEGIEFQALPGTLKEIEVLSDIAQRSGLKVALLKGPAASKEQVLKNMQSAQMIHLATHGFFSQAGLSSKIHLLGSSNLASHSIRQVDKRNPLALSGIILASDPEKSDAANQILSAEELIGCNLSSCQSIVLSACDSGLGENVDNQGVLGLRAAIMAAGARMLLISLWKVPDDATVALMSEFYNNILQKQESPAEALNHARKAVAAQERFKNTAFWGAWVLLGEGW